MIFQNSTIMFSAWWCWNAKQTQSQVILSFSVCLSLTCTRKPLLTAGGLLWVLWCHGNCLIPFSQALRCQRSSDPKTLLSLILRTTLFLTHMLSSALHKFIQDALVSVVMMDSFPLCWPYWIEGRGGESRGEKQRRKRGNMGVVWVFILYESYWLLNRRHFRHNLRSNGV